MTDIRTVLTIAATVARANEAAYSRLDAAAGDGDFGGVLALAADRVRAALADTPDADDRTLLLTAAHAVATVGGTTGPIWGTGLLRAADAIGSGPAAALTAAAYGIREIGGADAGDRTLLDALIPLAEALTSGGDAVAAARAGAQATAELPARRGRARYVPGYGVGHVDAGAQAVADLAAAVAGGHLPAVRESTSDPSAPAVASPGHVVGDPARLVDDAIEGLVASSQGTLRAESDPRLVCRADLPKEGLVTLISGGGSGHEPMHTGLIGPGLLTAACPGEVFASPSAAQVAAAIERVDGGAGSLLIVKNYTGDVLNFRLGADLARAGGHTVDTVLVADDIALEGDPADRRGVAGTVVVEKLCGAAAEAGARLPEVAALGRRVAAQTWSIGVAVSGVTLPSGGEPAITLQPGEQEFGVGIHGEAGRERGPAQPAKALVARMVGALLDASGLTAGDPVLLYTNGLGGLAGVELGAAHAYALRELTAAGLTVARSMAGTLVTSLGMAGLSLTLTRLDDELPALWDAPCSSAAWTRA